MAIAATLPLAAAPALHARTTDMEFDMPAGGVFDALQTRGLPTESVQELSLWEIATIEGILGSDEPEDRKTRRIRAILEGSN